MKNGECSVGDENETNLQNCNSSNVSTYSSPDRESRLELLVFVFRLLSQSVRLPGFKIGPPVVYKAR